MFKEAPYFMELELCARMQVETFAFALTTEKKCIQKVFPSPIKKGKKGQTRPPREAFISATSKSFSQLYLGYCPNVSLLNNAPNYLVGCVIKKR